MTDGATYRLYVPADPERTHIAPASAIVGEARGDVVDVHYEKGGASNVVTFEDRITHAAGRRISRYGTTARAALPASELVDVGSVRYDGTLRRWVIGEIDDAEALEAWAPETHVVGGSPHLIEEAANAIYSRMNASGMTEVAMESGVGDSVAEAILRVAARPGRMRS